MCFYKTTLLDSLKLFKKLILSYPKLILKLLIGRIFLWSYRDKNWRTRKGVPISPKGSKKLRMWSTGKQWKIKNNEGGSAPKLDKKIKIKENVPKGIYYDPEYAYVYCSVPSPPFSPISLPHPSQPAETMKLTVAFLNTSYLYFAPHLRCKSSKTSWWILLFDFSFWK